MKHLAATFLALSIGTFLGLAQDSDACGVCHDNIYKEWLQSRHSQAWKSPEFQAQLKSFGKPERCGRCHAPASIWQQVSLRPANPLDPNPTAEDYTPELNTSASMREQRTDEGVNCGSCHFVEVLWPRSTAQEFLGPYHSEVGHGGKAEEAFQNFKVCGACHGRAGGDYLPGGSGAAAGFHHRDNIAFQFEEGVDCSTCHMPRSEDTLVQLRVFKNLPVRQVGEHTFSGVRYQELEKALKLSLGGEGDETVLIVTNEGVGHPPRISRKTGYHVVVSGQKVELAGLESLAKGESLSFALPAPAGASVELEFYRSEPGGFEQELFTTVVEKEE